MPGHHGRRSPIRSRARLFECYFLVLVVVLVVGFEINRAIVVVVRVVGSVLGLRFWPILYSAVSLVGIGRGRSERGRSTIADIGVEVVAISCFGSGTFLI